MRECSQRATGERTFAKGMFAKEHSRGKVREGTFMRERLRRVTGKKINVCERTFAKGDEGENSLEGMFAWGDLQGHRSSSTGELHVVESVHCIIITRGKKFL